MEDGRHSHSKSKPQYTKLYDENEQEKHVCNVKIKEFFTNGSMSC